MPAKDRNDLSILFTDGEEDFSGTDMIRRHRGNRRISELFLLIARRKNARIKIGGDIFEVCVSRIEKKAENPFHI